MSGLLGRLADLAGRTLAAARAMPLPRADDEQTAADATSDVSSPPAGTLTEVREPSDHDHETADHRAPAASQGEAPEAAPESADRRVHPAPPQPMFAPRPVGAGPAPPGGDAAPSLPSPDRTSRPLGEAPAPGSETDQRARAAQPGLLRDVEVRVVSPLLATPRAPIRPEPDDPRPELAERWRELGARLRAAHPPTGRATALEEVGESEASARPEIAAPALVPQAQPAPNGSKAALRRSELIIRHLEIRIVAAAKQSAPAAESRPPEPPAGAWQTAARRYLRL
jgi:hypothetical protein